MTNRTLKFAAFLIGFFVSLSSHAQSTVGELIGKGGKQSTKAELTAQMSMRIQQNWPNGQGEEELLLTADGKITGVGRHYASGTVSPVEGAWSVEDDGKFCAPKKLTRWGTNTNLCWYVFKLGDAVYSASKTDTEAKLFRSKAVTKVVE